MLEKAKKLVNEWHEAGRESFNKSYSNLNYDSYAEHKAIEKKKYINLDCSNSGMYMLDKTTGLVFGIKAYGVPNKKKCIGYIEHITGLDLAKRDHYYLP